MARPLTDDIAQGPPPPPPSGSGWGGDAPSDGPGASRRASLILTYLLLVSSTVVFLSFTLAFGMRRSIATDWISMSKPPILWVNTVVLLVSSAMVELARRALRSGNRVAFNQRWTAATVLGILFLLGQGLAWRELKAAGLYIASNPSVSFFYILTATHAVHLLGAITALVYVDIQALRFHLGPAKRTAIDMSAIFWHFLDVLWLCLMALFYIWG
ncbi:MAG: cytochrome-c oxidase [Terriglobia bacterium]|nr:MAG: cytochrome-c oxidase [Terriglobia bacterium]